ncbi:MAG TPA: Ku protein [Actinocrinis sp.]|nr:Ku protein [Actinocrinis sp.]
MRSSWKGAISFGLVTVPVALAPAVEEHSIPLHQVHAKDGGRVRMRRVCELEEREIPFSEIAKGYDTDDEQTVVLTNDDLADLPLPTKKVIDVLAFVDESQIDPVYFAKPYYVAPDKAGAKQYALLRDAMAGSGQVAVTKITLSTRESPAVLRVHDDVLVLQLMVWPDEVRSVAGIAPEEATVRPQELAMAKSLIETLSADFPDLAHDLHDDYQAALANLVEAKLEGAVPAQEAPSRPAKDNVIDLMAVLERSVEAAQGSRARRGGSAETGAETAPRAKKAAAKAAPGRRAAADKAAEPGAESAPAKKAPAKKAAKKTPAKKAPAAKTRRRAS